VQYQYVMLPLTVCAASNCVLEPTKEKVLADHAMEWLAAWGG